MTTSYCGMYRSDSPGSPSHVQVVALGGHTFPLPIDQNESREDRQLLSIQPMLTSTYTTVGWSLWGTMGGS
jgi:hypothetical protein